MQLNMLWKRLRVLGSVAHYHPKCQSGTSAPHLDSVCVPVGKICIIRIVFQSLKVIAKGFYMGEHLSSNWNSQSIYLLHVKYLQRIIDFGIGGRRKLNLHIILCPPFLQVFACLRVCRFTSSFISSD